jgi:hypothetical protein
LINDGYVEILEFDEVRTDPNRLYQTVDEICTIAKATIPS